MTLSERAARLMGIPLTVVVRGPNWDWNGETLIDPNPEADFESDEPIAALNRERIRAKVINVGLDAYIRQLETNVVGMWGGAARQLLVGADALELLQAAVETLEALEK